MNAVAIRKHISNSGRLGKEKLAVAAGVSVSLLEKILSIPSKAPRLENCIRIAQAMGLPVDEVFPEACQRKAG